MNKANRLFSQHMPPPRNPIRATLEDAGGRDRVVWGVNHVVGAKALDITDDRNRTFLDDLGQFLGMSGLGFGLANGGIHDLLLPGSCSPRQAKFHRWRGAVLRQGGQPEEVTLHISW